MNQFRTIIELSQNHFYYNDNNSVYVLSLNDNKYYVGLSSQLNIRISNHLINPSTKWVKNFPVMNIKCIIKNSNRLLENDLTLYLMNIYGWDNVRGGAWTKVIMDKPPNIIKNKVFLIFDNIPTRIKKLF